MERDLDIRVLFLHLIENLRGRNHRQDGENVFLLMVGVSSHDVGHDGGEREAIVIKLMKDYGQIAIQKVRDDGRIRESRYRSHLCLVGEDTNYVLEAHVYALLTGYQVYSLSKGVGHRACVHSTVTTWVRF